MQINTMKLHYPDFECFRGNEDNLYFIGKIQPSETMSTYTLSIHFRGDKMPHVKVIDPELVIDPPHFYHDQKCLCLYKPSNFIWSGAKPIYNYIIPWTACWLYFYEVWKETGTWYGPEAEHNNIKKTSI